MRVRANKTIRYKGETYLKGEIIEVDENDLKRILKGDKVAKLGIYAQEDEDIKEIIKKVPLSYLDLLEFSHKEFDEVDEELKIESKGTIAERTADIWEFLSKGPEENENL